MIWAEKRATDGGTLQMEADYAYDAFGNRIQKAVDPDGAGEQGTETTRFGYDGWKVHQDAQGNETAFIGNENWDVWMDLNGSNQLQTRRQYLDAIDSVFARVSSAGAAAWYLAERLGSVRDVLNASGAVIDHIDYDGFGRKTNETNPANGDRFGYTGQEHDAITGFISMGNGRREYSVDIGRFVTEDPLGFGAGDVNLFRYVGNSPTFRTDPSGLKIYKFDKRGNQKHYWAFIYVPDNAVPPSEIKTYAAFTADEQKAVNMVQGNPPAEQELVELLNTINQSFVLPNIFLLDGFPWTQEFFGNHCVRWTNTIQDSLIANDRFGKHLVMRQVKLPWPPPEDQEHSVVLFKLKGGKTALGVDNGTLGGSDHIFDPAVEVGNMKVPKEARESLEKAWKAFIENKVGKK